jgi:hypothetical protein
MVRAREVLSNLNVPRRSISFFCAADLPERM